MSESKSYKLDTLLKSRDTSVDMEDFFETSETDYDQFDVAAWKKGDGYDCPNFPEFGRRMEGLDLGLYLFAGESNSGKSALLMNLLYDFCTKSENKLFGVYYSLDDAKEEIIPRLIAMNERIPISVASKPRRYQNLIDQAEENASVYAELLEKRSQGLARLRAMKRVFKVVDGVKIANAEQLVDHASKVQMYVKSFDPDANIIIGIDSISDIRFGLGPTKDLRGKELNEHIAGQVKDWAVRKLKIPVFGTLHLRKLNQLRRPTLDDLKDSVMFVYEASVVFLVYNDVSKTQQAATIYYNQEERDEKMPILELNWAKNKKSSFKGTTYHYFAPDYSKVTECQKEAMDRYNALIYTN